MSELLHSALNVLRGLARPNVYVPPQDLNRVRSLLSRACESQSIPQLLPVLFSGSALANVAAETVQVVIVNDSPSVVARLSEPIRAAFNGYQLYGKVSPRDVPRLWPELSGVQGVLSMHPSGYVREAAVGQLGAIHDGTELPFLVLRLNDWVEPVRDRAAVAVRDRLRPEYCRAIVRCLPLVRRLARQSRCNHDELIAAIEALLLDDSCRHVLKEAVQSNDRETRRYALDLVLRLDDREGNRVSLEVLRSDDTVIRLHAARSLARHVDRAELQTVLPRLLHDRFMPVRREALNATIERLPERAQDTLREALFDPHRSIREFARYHLGARGVLEFTQIYRQALVGANPKAVPAIILGLAETGSAADAATLRAYLQDPDPRTRAAAIYGVARLDGDSHIRELLTALVDRSARVSRMARDMLRERVYLLRPRVLEEALGTPGATPHVIRNTLELVALLNWWDSIPVLLRAAASENAMLREHAAARVNEIVGNRRLLAALPTADQLRDFEQLLSEHRRGLDPNTAAAIDQLARRAHDLRA